MTSISGIPVQSTKNLINPDTKICMMVFADPKTGKTRFSKTLDDMTRKHFGKRTLFIALEAAEGGGTMTLQEFDPPLDYVTPRSYTEFGQIIAWLKSDPTYGGVVVDSSSEYVSRFLKPYALAMPYTRGTPDASRTAGVPGQSDYHTMGEKAREDFNKLIELTTLPDKRLRKHLVVTALQKDKISRDGNTLIAIQPALPGSMADVATSMFQTVAGIVYKTDVTPDPSDPKKTIRNIRRVLAVDASVPANAKRLIGDRTSCIPEGSPLDFVEIWERNWIPRWEKAA